jgi:hypothetical protein
MSDAEPLKRDPLDPVAAALDRLAGDDGQLPDNTKIQVCLGPAVAFEGHFDELDNGHYAVTVEDRGFGNRVLVFHHSKVLWARAFKG